MICENARTLVDGLCNDGVLALRMILNLRMRLFEGEFGEQVHGVDLPKSRRVWIRSGKEQGGRVMWTFPRTGNKNMHLAARGLLV